MDHKSTNSNTRTKLTRTKTHPITFQEKFLNNQNNFPDHYHLYIDGSKQRRKVSCATILQNQQLLKRLLNKPSIYRAKVTAIDLATNILTNHKSSKFIINSDSRSILLVQQNKDTSLTLIIKLLNKMNTLSKKKK